MVSEWVCKLACVGYVPLTLCCVVWYVVRCVVCCVLCGMLCVVCYALCGMLCVVCCALCGMLCCAVLCGVSVVGLHWQTVDDGDETCLTVVFINEDHTLGNMLRYILSKQPQVEFVGYAVPHPSENTMNLRLQTNGPPAATVLQQAFADMEAMANILEAKFEDAYAQVN